MRSDKRTREKILQIVDKIKKGYEPEKIVLFGSYAYGKPTPDSDIDLLIIKKTKASKLKRWITLKRLAYNPNRGFPFSPLVYTSELPSATPRILIRSANEYTPGELKKRLSLGDDFIILRNCLWQFLIYSFTPFMSKEILERGDVLYEKK